MNTKILAIESSCDETAAAVVEDGRKVLSSVVATQIDKHVVFGGVVPEIASRLHTESISIVTEQALCEAECTLSDIDAIAVTAAPGLIGALLVGVGFAKGLSFSSGLPLFHTQNRAAETYSDSRQTVPQPRQASPKEQRQPAGIKCTQLQHTAVSQQKTYHRPAFLAQLYKAEHWPAPCGQWLHAEASFPGAFFDPAAPREAPGFSARRARPTIRAISRPVSIPAGISTSA